MEFRVHVKVEVEQPGHDLSVKTPAELQLVCRGGRWQALCSDPPVLTDLLDTMEAAIVAGAKEVAAEMRVVS